MKSTSQARSFAGAEPDILVSRSLADYRNWWARSDRSASARCYAFQRPDIVEIWLETIGRARGIEPCFVAVLAPSGEPAMLLPLGMRRHHGTLVLEFIDAGYSDYNAPVLFADKALAWDGPQLWSALVRHLPRFDVAILEKMPDLIGDLANPLAALAQHAHDESGHAVRLYEPWTLFARERIRHLSDSNRRRRKLERLGPVRIAIAATAEEREQFLAAMMRLKRRKFVETHGLDAFTLPGATDFYRTSTGRLGAAGTVQLSALLLGERILAAHWGYVVGNRFYHLMPAHESGEWRAYAPGRLLNEWLLQWAIEQKLEYLDFGIGDEPYKFDYCDVHIALHDAYLPQTMRGRVLAAAARARSAARDHLKSTHMGQALIDVRRRWRLRAGGPAAGEPS